MFPEISYFNSRNCWLTYSKRICNFHLCSIVLSNRNNLLFCQFRKSIMLTFMNNKFIPIFIHHILCVIFCCAKKQMKRIYASSSIAFMKNTNSIRNRDCAINHPRNSMRSIKLSFDIYLPISFFPTTSSPDPTPGFRDRLKMTFKSFFDCSRFWSFFHKFNFNYSY